MFPYLRKINFFNPFHALLVFLFGLLIVLVLLDREGAFEDFTKFGPDDKAHFLKIKLDTWPKVIIVYIISFLCAILQQYFMIVIGRGFIGSRILNPNFKKMETNKDQSKFIIYLYPICLWSLNIVTFFVTLTMKLQFLLPYLFGSAIVNNNYLLYELGKKSF